MIDSNILIYAYDLNDPVKQNRAQELIADLAERGELVVSVQSLNEFYHAATRPHRPLRFPMNVRGNLSDRLPMLLSFFLSPSLLLCAPWRPFRAIACLSGMRSSGR